MHPTRPQIQPAPLIAALSHAPHRLTPNTECVIGVLPGEGIGPEIIDASLHVLDTLSRHIPSSFRVEFGGKIGLPALKESGNALSEEVIDFCQGIFSQQGAILCGPGGGRFVYELRSRFDLFCKFTPIRPLQALLSTGAVTPQARAGVDIVMVRENIGGAYFGEWGTRLEQGETTAFHHIEYRTNQVRRILEVAAKLAAMRRGHLCLVLKPGGIPAISALWEQMLHEVTADTRLSTKLLEVDNASYQLISDARELDVVVSPNMWGDILADCGSLLLGSRGVSYSGNFNPEGSAVFQTAHGAAYDLAGSDRANPIGQILSLAMLLRECFAMPDVAQAIETAIEHTLTTGWRTPDIATPGSMIIGTREMGQRIAAALDEQIASPNTTYETSAATY